MFARERSCANPLNGTYVPTLSRRVGLVPVAASYTSKRDFAAALDRQHSEIPNLDPRGECP